MAMTQEEKIEIADMVRSRDRFGPVSEEELAALPGKETELWIRTKNGKTVHVFEERPENLPEQAALLLNFHGGGFLKGRTDRDRIKPMPLLVAGSQRKEGLVAVKVLESGKREVFRRMLPFFVIWIRAFHIHTQV